jgi:hypothetical protein
MATCYLGPRNLATPQDAPRALSPSGERAWLAMPRTDVMGFATAFGFHPNSVLREVFDTASFAATATRVNA